MPDSSNQKHSPVCVFIGIGANLDDPVRQIEQAISSIQDLAGCKLLSQSSFYRTSPMGPQDQDDYINAVVKIETTLDPVELLDATQAIEKQQGRVRKAERWGPRTLDLDILLYNNSEVNHERLVVPHYGMRERNFVLLPLAEIEPEICLPDGTSIQQLLKNIDDQGMCKL